MIIKTCVNDGITHEIMYICIQDHTKFGENDNITLVGILW